MGRIYDKEYERDPPQRPNPNKPGDHVPVRINFDEPVNLVPEEESTDKKEVNMRRFRITIPMLNKHGYTEGCEGCRFKQAGLDATRAHSEACRKRLAEALGTEDGAIERENERLAAEVSEEDKTKEDRDEDMGINGNQDNIEIEGGKRMKKMTLE